MSIRYLSGINVDNNVLFVDSANNVVGVSTAAPYSGLSTRLYIGYAQNNSVVNQDEFVSVGAAGGSTNKAGVNFLIYNAGYGGRIYTDDNVVRGLAFDVLESGTFYNAISITRSTSPNVGIGTTSPTHKLHVLNAAAVAVIGDGNDNYFGNYSSGDYWDIGNLGATGNVYLESRGASVNINNQYRAKGAGSHIWTYNGGSNEVMRTTSDGNLLIGTTTNSGEKLFVQGAGRFVNQLRAYNLLSDNQIKGSAYVELSPDQTTYNAWNIRVGAQAADACYYITGGGVNILTTEGYNNPYTVKLYSNGVQTLTMTNGSVRLNTYGSGSKTGTVAYNLAVDSSGNIIETAGGVVDGSGTANYVSKWSDANTLTDSVIYDNGTSVGVGTTTPNPFSWATKTITVVSSASNSYAALEAYGNGTGAGALLLGNTSILRASILAEDGSNLLFATNAGNTGSSQSERMRITAAGNVGIGTTSPADQLSISNSAGTSISITTGQAAGSIASPKFTDINFRGYLNTPMARIRSWDESSSTADGYLTFWTNDFDGVNNFTEKMRITPTGNVGIGTTSPAVKLHVAGTTETSIRVSDSGGSYMELYQQSTDSYILASNSLRFYNGGSERMRITSGGNVGIGITAPASKLHVFDGTNTVVTIQAGNQPSVQLNTTDGLANAELFNSYGNVGLVGNLTSSNYIMYHYGGGGTLASQYTYFQTAGVERMRITGAGNVGIGTTSPSAKLEVLSAVSATPITNGLLRIVGTGTNPATGAGGGLLLAQQDSAGSYVNYASITGRRVNNAANNIVDLDFNTGSPSDAVALATRMTITGNAGNVGIGTTSPAYKLEVNGSFATITSGIYLEYNSGILYHAGGSGNYYQYISGTNYLLSNRTATGALVFSTVDTERMRITSGGNVLIGTTADTPLSTARGIVINSGASNDAQIRLQNNTTGSTGSDGALFSLSGTGVYLWNYENDAIFFGTNNSTRITITSSGNVGIGLTNPSYKLDVTGDARINTGSLGVNVAPNATDGRIDASNDIVAFSTSDRRLKENITPIANALEKVRSLTGVEFDWKEETKSVHGYEGHDVGVIAQDVQAVLPEAVRTNDSGYLSVRYEKMIALLVEANKELADRVEQLEKLIK